MTSYYIFQVVDVVLAIAAGLSVQSPFHRAAMREEQARVSTCTVCLVMIVMRTGLPACSATTGI